MDWDMLVPISICVVLPVMIVWLINRTRQNETNKKTEIILKAIEVGATIDTDFFKTRQVNKTIKERLLRRLTGGCIFTLLGVASAITGLVNMSQIDATRMSTDSFTIPFMVGGFCFAIGLALLVSFFVGKKMLAKEMEAEAKELEKK